MAFVDEVGKPSQQHALPGSEGQFPMLQHHAFLFQNERVRVSEMVVELKNIAKESSSAIHLEVDHHYPTVRWQAEPEEKVFGLLQSLRWSEIEMEEGISMSQPQQGNANVTNPPFKATDDSGTVSRNSSETLSAADLQNLHDWTVPVEIRMAEGGGGGEMKSRQVPSPGSKGTALLKIPDRKVFYVHPQVRLEMDFVLDSMDGVFESLDDAPAHEMDEALEPVRSVETKTSTVFRQIVFEILSETPKCSEDKVQEMLNSCPLMHAGVPKCRGAGDFEQQEEGDEDDEVLCSTDVGTKKVYENDLVRVWDFYLDPGEGGHGYTVHHHVLDYVFVNVEASRLIGYNTNLRRITKIDGETNLEKPGLVCATDEAMHKRRVEFLEKKGMQIFDNVSERNQVTFTYIPERSVFQDERYAHGGFNGYSDKPMREYLVELK